MALVKCPAFQNPSSPTSYMTYEELTHISFTKENKKAVVVIIYCLKYDNGKKINFFGEILTHTVVYKKQ